MEFRNAFENSIGELQGMYRRRQNRVPGSKDSDATARLGPYRIMEPQKKNSVKLVLRLSIYTYINEQFTIVFPFFFFILIKHIV